MFQVAFPAGYFRSLCPVPETKPCGLRPCPMDCKLSSWLPDAKGCSQSCGSGAMVEIRSVQRSQEHGGRCPEPSSPERFREVACNIQPCPVDCKLSEWTQDTERCSKICGNGTVLESRSVVQQAAHGGACPEADSAERQRHMPCNTEPCAMAVVAELRDALTSTEHKVQDATHLLDDARARNTKLLHQFAKFDCTAGISDEQKRAAAACRQHNELADATTDLATEYENVFDECSLVAVTYKQLITELKQSLPFIVQCICDGDLVSGNNSLSLLMYHMGQLQQQIDVCMKPVQDGCLAVSG